MSSKIDYVCASYMIDAPRVIYQPVKTRQHVNMDGEEKTNYLSACQTYDGRVSQPPDT